MILLLDTHLLLWAKAAPERLSASARDMLTDPANDLCFSVASIWEVAIKAALGRTPRAPDPGALRRRLIEDDYRELAIAGAHAAAVAGLPSIHKDPFDRILVAQAIVEGFLLLTADPLVARYPGPVRMV